MSDYKLTSNDCKKILEQHLKTRKFQLISYEEQSVANEVAGIMGGHYKLKTHTLLPNNEIICSSFFVKKMTSPYEIQTKMIKEVGAYEKEYFSYKKIPELYESETYKCDFLAECYLTIEDELFVFEDVMESGGMAPRVKDFLDLEHMKIALKTIAKLHAGSIIYENKKQTDSGTSYCILDDFSSYFADPIYRKNNREFIGDKFYLTCVRATEALIDVVFPENSQNIKEKFLKFSREIYDLVLPSTKYKNVVCHGDLWNSNMVFKYENNRPISVVLLDFQDIRYTIPAHDFAYFTICNGYTDSHEMYHELVTFYYNSLKVYLYDNNIDLNQHMTLDEFLNSLKYIEPFVIIQNACYATLCLIRMNDNIKTDQKMVEKFFYEDRNQLCLEAYKDNEEFRNIVDAALIPLNRL